MHIQQETKNGDRRGQRKKIKNIKKNLPKLIRHQVTNLRRHMNQSKIGSKKTTHRHIIVKLLKKK